MYQEDGKLITWETFGFGKYVDRTKIVTVLGKPNFRSKPESAWWGSRTDATFGWKHWCEREEFRQCDEFDKSVWGLSDDSRILKVSRDDLEILKYIVETKNYSEYYPIDVEKHLNCIMNGDSIFGSYAIDFEKIKSDGYDAVELMDGTIGHGFYDLMSVLTCFNGWDCESIVILSPEKIVFL